MSRRDISKSKKVSMKNIILFVLILAVFAMSIMWLLKINNSTKTKQVITDLINVQINLSEYFGKLKSETFDIYTTEDIIIGSTDIQKVEETRIKDNDNKEISQIVITDNILEKNNITFYKINIDIIEKDFGLKLYEDKNIIWYIQETGQIKVSYINKPIWWTDELDAIYVGK